MKEIPDSVDLFSSGFPAFVSSFKFPAFELEDEACDELSVLKCVLVSVLCDVDVDSEVLVLSVVLVVLVSVVLVLVLSDVDVDSVVDPSEFLFAFSALDPAGFFF